MEIVTLSKSFSLVSPVTGTSVAIPEIYKGRAVRLLTLAMYVSLVASATPRVLNFISVLPGGVPRWSVSAETGVVAVGLYIGVLGVSGFVNSAVASGDDIICMGQGSPYVDASDNLIVRVLDNQAGDSIISYCATLGIT